MFKKIFFFASIFFCGQVFSYKFICNGLLPDGRQRYDQCGKCDEESAARWENPNVFITIANEPRPQNISYKDWHYIVEKSMHAWNSVAGSAFRFLKSNEKNTRMLGGNEGLHEIFWITDVAEWRTLVGVGEVVTLGATLPNYMCGDLKNPSRTIYDADLVLNGLPHINRQVTCDMDDLDCLPVQSTLVHEMGHFLGLDHPCLFCSTSIMSAKAGFDLSVPVSDDILGLLALYPKGNRAKEGMSCSKKPCDNGLVCAGRQKKSSHCFLTCQSHDDCDVIKSCVSINPDKPSLCIAIKREGQDCSQDEICEDGSICLFEVDTGNGYCRRFCGQSNKCSFLESCLEVQGQKLCIPDRMGIDLNNSSLGFDTSGFSDSLDYNNDNKNKMLWSCQHVDGDFLSLSCLGLVVLLNTFILHRKKSTKVHLEKNDI